MKDMFRNAASFTHSLCGTRWVRTPNPNPILYPNPNPNPRWSKTQLVQKANPNP